MSHISVAKNDSSAIDSQRNKSFRPDIEGLRAVAVLLVVANHLIAFPEGGYIGVDVFFVISGYLITGQLFRESAKTGWISFTGFYAKRLRRIVPAATLVAAVTAAVSYSIWYLPRASQTSIDGLASLFWVSNWHFAAAGTDYLQASGPISPFQHYWSLSVEEQFYVFWPWLLLALGSIFTKASTPTYRTCLMVGIAMVAVLSYFWAIVETATNPTFAYFDTAARAWEFAAGALIALSAHRIREIRWPWTKFLSAIGLTIIFGSSIALTATSSFPGPWALVPVFGAVLFIFGNESRLGWGMSLVTNKVARYVGRISYSLYLWHFPVIVYLTVLFPHSIWAPALSIPIMFLLAHLTYRYVETPVRHSAWLRSWEGYSTSAQQMKPSRRYQVLLAVGTAGLIIGLSVAQLKGPDVLRNAAAASALLNDRGPAASVGRFDTESHIAGEIDLSLNNPKALRVTVPAVNQLDASQESEAMNTSTGCRNTVGTLKPKICVHGEETAPKRAVILGDSMAMSWVPTINAALESSTWRTTTLGYANCSPYDVDTMPSVPNPSFIAQCRESKKHMQKLVDEVQPDVVFLSGGIGDYQRQADGSVGEAAKENWAAAVERTTAALSVTGARVIVMSSPPPGQDTLACVDRITAFAKCERTIPDVWFEKTLAESFATARAVQSGAQADFVDSRSWFCGANNACPAVIGPYIVRFDSGHMTNAFAESLGTLLRGRLSGFGMPMA
ncbi:acyltransferase family protein [Arthrobacter sp. S39]|uniref:acyltransferase family protein n=1 Tax=Arthrobacter sp. S39 TaxID=2509720 RepID=UPI0010378C03|nr:acyltransferase family protein [Arthrobacter sp. S39]TAP45173.1 acyltransferase [Arthrobacter sp. S39]